MRPKLEEEKRRSEFIGIKVKPETKKKLEFIAERDAETLSTKIDKILKEYIERYFEIAKINWEEYK